MDRETGKPILDNGKEVTAEKEFTVETSNGFVDLEFTFNTIPFAGKTVVVFEDVYQNGKLVGTHSNIDDINQSIKILEKEKVKTGDDENILHSIFGIVLAGSLMVAFRIKKRY